MIEPRLQTSTKWVKFPIELLDQIKSVIEENFKDLSEQGKIVVEGRIYPQEIILRLGYLQNGRLRQYNFETSVDYHPHKDSVLQHIHVCVDLIGQLFQMWAEEDTSGDFIHTWTSHELDGFNLFYKNSSVNTDLEAAANALLGEESEALLLNLDQQSEDLEELQSKLSEFKFNN